MSWDERSRHATGAGGKVNYAVEFDGMAPVDWWTGSSACSILLHGLEARGHREEGPGDGGIPLGESGSVSGVLRMFAAFGSNGAPAFPVPPIPSSWCAGDEFIGYVDADARGDFSETSPTSFSLTRIPAVRFSASAWEYEQVTGYSGEVPSVAVDQAFFAVIQKDPSVVRVPASLGGGWLMLLFRGRIVVSGRMDLNTIQWTAEGLSDAMKELREWVNPNSPPDPSGVRPPAGTTAGASLADIVGYWCDEPTFTSAALKGPFLVVDSLQAVEDQNFRLWLGVPSGVFTAHPGADGHPELWVYYVAEQTQGGVYDWPDTTLPPADSGYPYDAPGYSAAVHAWHTAGGLPWTYPGDARTGHEPGFDGGIAVSRFTGTEVRDQLFGSAPRGESNWNRTDAWTSDFRKKVRVWVANGTVLNDVRTLKGAYGDDTGLRTKDPSAFLHGSSLNLLFAGMGGTYSAATAPIFTGQGIWRAVTVPHVGIREVPSFASPGEIASMPGTEAEFGVDFVISTLDGGLESRDLVARSSLDVEIHADPDIVYVPGTTHPWWVWCSGAPYWEQYGGDDADVAGLWTDAFI